MGRKEFVSVLRAVAQRHNLSFRALSHDWVIQICDPSKPHRVCNVFGYTFDINGAGAAEICKEKSATSMVLAGHGVANVEHRVFLNPANENTAPYVPRDGNARELRRLIDEDFGGLPVVIKPLKGSGGLDVVKAATYKEVEAAVQLIFAREYGASELETIILQNVVLDEYRCVILDDRVYVAYQKVRPFVVGDGTRTVADLVAHYVAQAPLHDQATLCAAVHELGETLASVPASGERVLLRWKHNLGTGAKLKILDDAASTDLTAKLKKLALEAVHAVGMRFCSVDIIDTAKEGLMVMEINSGVMMDSLIAQLGPEGERLADEIYETAVLTALEAADTKRH